MTRYILRLDDASDYMCQENWNRILTLLDNYNIKPLIAVIPDNKDISILSKYKKELNFWDQVREWQDKGYSIGLHGYNHIFHTKDGGINPVNNYSEFAGVDLDRQRDKIKKGMKIFQENKISSSVFVAPAHTFDENTLKALKLESNIRIISDTIASKPYLDDGIFYIPQQMGIVRKSPLPMKLITFCYHPNTMEDKDFFKLEKFIIKNIKKFEDLNEIKLNKRKKSLYDKILSYLYFRKRKN